MNYINLKPEDYNTQRNNKIKPGVSCMPTSRDMFYSGNNIEITNNSGYHNDDYFMYLLNTDEARKFCDQKYPWSNTSKKIYPPNEIHGMYPSWLDEKVIGKRVSDFLTNLSWDDYINRMINGEVMMTSGAFAEIGIDGHCFCIIGYGEDGNLRLADPYGVFPWYRDHNGYNVIMTYDDFIKRIFPLNQPLKWGHVII